MATVARTDSDINGDGSVIQSKWTLTGTNDGEPLLASQWADRSVQVGVTGDNFNAGTVIIEGSNDGTTWTNISNPAGSALSFTAAGLKQILENTAYVRPRASVSVTSVQVFLVARRTNPMRT